MVILTILKFLDINKLTIYDKVYELVILAIKNNDVDKIDQFYKAYEIDDNHPLKWVIESLIDRNSVLVTRNKISLTEDLEAKNNVYLIGILNHDIPNQE